MKKPVICICANPKPIEKLFYLLRKNFNKTVAARLAYNIEHKKLTIQLKQVVENPSAIVCYETPLDQLTPIAFDSLLNPILNTQYNGTRCTAENIQLFIGTYQKPLLTKKQEKKAFFYDIPEKANATVIYYFLKIIWLDINITSIPSLLLCTTEGEKLIAYYNNRKANYRKRIQEITVK